jgi:hypothetical protein
VVSNKQQAALGASAAAAPRDAEFALDARLGGRARARVHLGECRARDVLLGGRKVERVLVRDRGFS